MTIINSTYKYRNVILLSGVALVIIGVLFIKRKELGNWLDSVHNQIYIDTLNVSAKPYFEKLFVGIRKLGYEPYFVSSWRGYDKTIALKAQNSKNANISYHNFGVAGDINIKKDGVIVLSKASSKEAWEASGIPQLAKKLGFIWGGTDIPNYYDPNHFDLRNIWPMDKLLSIAKQKYTGLENIMNNGNKITLS